MEMKDYLVKNLAEMGIELTEIQLEQFNKYYELLIEWNKKINLTRITEPEEVAVKHFADSLSLLDCYEIPQGAKVIDVGTGAGFPGIPLKIACPDIKLTLLDSLNKRLIFLEEVCDSLGIEADIVHLRAEEGGRKPQLRENFDIAVSRAVARLNVLSEYCLPYVKKGGDFIAMKGPDPQEEISEGEIAIEKLGGKIDQVVEFYLPDDSGRTIVIVGKDKNTPKQYPRQGTKIKDKPIR